MSWMPDGDKQYTDLIVNNPEGMTATLAQFRYMLQNTVCLTDVSAKDQGMTEQQLAAPDIWMADKDNSWGYPTTLTMTTQEADDCTTPRPVTSPPMLRRTSCGYIIGDAPISDLDSFVDTCVSMGLEDCLAIQQAALDRYYERID